MEVLHVGWSHFLLFHLKHSGGARDTAIVNDVGLRRHLLYMEKFSSPHTLIFFVAVHL